MQHSQTTSTQNAIVKLTLSLEEFIAKYIGKPIVSEE